MEKKWTDGESWPNDFDENASWMLKEIEVKMLIDSRINHSLFQVCCNKIYYFFALRAIKFKKRHCHARIQSLNV